MIKMVVNVWKRPDMSDEQFKNRWLVEHGALVKQHAKAMGFVKYIQSHKLPSPEIEEFGRSRGWTTPPDGLTEVWWHSAESMRAAFASPEGQEASAILEKDENQFIDVKRISCFLAEEEVIFDFDTDA